MNNKPQIDKFREAAKELECDESEEAFERKLKKVTRPTVSKPNEK